VHFGEGDFFFGGGILARNIRMVGYKKPWPSPDNKTVFLQMKILYVKSQAIKNMKNTVLIAACGLLVSCASSSPTVSLEEVEKKRSEYFHAVYASTKRLDDGKSPADVVARAALAENTAKFHSFLEAHMAHDEMPPVVMRGLRNNMDGGLDFTDQVTARVLRNRTGR
jgi:hypothetical protein